MSVKDRVTIVTGSGRGIGEGIAMKLAENGAKLVINDLNMEDANRVVDQIRETGGQAIAIKADVTKWPEVESLMKDTMNLFGRIDILVNNAGTVRDNLILNMPEEDFDFIVNLCLKGSWLCSKAALKYMKEQQSGRVINISSRAWLGAVGQSNYSSAKAGVIGLTRALALEYAKYGITVNAIAPGLIDTPLIRSLRPDVQERLVKAQPTPIIGQPYDIAYGVLFFAADNARYVTGQVLHIDGGKSLGARY